MRGKYTFRIGREIPWDNYFQAGNRFARGEVLFI